MGNWTIGHVGICVADLARSLSFWCDGLGFERLRGFAFKSPSWRQVMEIDGPLDLHTQIIRRDGMTLELLHFLSPPADGDGARHPMTRLGFTHLALWVDDLDAMAARLVAHGGTIVDGTDTHFDHPRLRGRWLMCTDPDGIRLELIQCEGGGAIVEP
ncbi:VOC family protein [Sphingobium sp.]|uniref:VOC family protein n=1 Tax=Sphingobium sp. TaxID=1912891 RepID=UPI003B39FEAB